MTGKRNSYDSLFAAAGFVPGQEAVVLYKDLKDYNFCGSGKEEQECLIYRRS